MELKDLVKYYVPMRMEGSSPPNWEVVFGYDISKFKGYNVDEVRVALNLTQLWLSQGPRAFVIESMFIYLLCLSAALLCYTGFQNQSLIRSIFSPCSTCCFGLGFSTTKPAGIHQKT